MEDYPVVTVTPAEQIVYKERDSSIPPPCEIIIDVRVDPNDISKFVATARCDGGVWNP